MRIINTKLLGERIDSLSTKSLLVLSKISGGMSDEDIIAWSENWRFTPGVIRRALREIERALELPNICEEPSRRIAGRLYRIHSRKILRALRAKHVMGKTDAGQGFFQMREEQRIGELDVHLVEGATEKLRTLDNELKEIALHLVNGAASFDVGNARRSRLYRALGLASELPRNKHSILVAAYRSLNGG